MTAALNSQALGTQVSGKTWFDVEPETNSARPSRITANHVSARAPNWLKCRQLEEPLASILPIIPDYRDTDMTSLRAKTKAWLKRDLRHISHPDFFRDDAATLIFENQLGLAPPKRELDMVPLGERGTDLPVQLNRLCEAPLLTASQERMLFQRMNFLKHHASIHCNLLSLDHPMRARLELVERFALLAQWHRDRILEANLRLVFSIVKKLVNPNNTFDELLSDGIVGLMGAVEKFDYDRGFRFSTYATQVVRRNSYRMVVMRQQDRQMVVSGLQDMEFEVYDVSRRSAFSESRWHELRAHLSRMLDDLDRRERLIIRARFSLGSHGKVHTLQALADRLQISKERVRQLEMRAMAKLSRMASGVQLAELDA